MAEVLVRQLFRETEKFADSEVTVRGWIRTNRGSNKFGFVELNDGSSLQAHSYLPRMPNSLLKSRQRQSKSRQVRTLTILSRRRGIQWNSSER